MLIALCSDKGSPGTTTSAFALASVWSGSTLVVETDLFGGDLAVRLRTRRGDALPEAPTVLTVAAAARTSSDPDLVSRYAHPFTEAVAVVPGHLCAEQAGRGVDWESLGSALAASEVPVFVDLGRLQAASPLVGLAARADLVVVVGRPVPGSVIRLRERLARLVPAMAAHPAAQRGRSPRVYPLLVSAGRHGPANVADLRRVLRDSPANPFVAGAGFVSLDPGAVCRLERGEEPMKRLSRTALLRSAGAVCDDFVALLGTEVATVGVDADGSGAAGRRLRVPVRGAT